MTEHDLHLALLADPGDQLCYNALADLLEETGQEERAELLRCDLTLRDMNFFVPERQPVQDRLQELLRQGVMPSVPCLTNSVGMEFALIPGGSLRDPEVRKDSVFSRPMSSFYLGIFPVTVAQFDRIADLDGAVFRIEPCVPPSRPMVELNERDIEEFIRQLTTRPGEKGRKYRLPTQWEWEYACRANTDTYFNFGNSCNGTEANVDGRYPYGTDAQGPYLGKSTPVGAYKPNAWGLYDMHGNVFELCTEELNSHDVRGKGGSYYYGAQLAGSSCSSSYGAESRLRFVGFRLLLEVEHD